MTRVAALEEITKLFRKTYADERARFQSAQKTVILFRFSGATLFRNGQLVETARVIPSEYHNLRYAAHVPFMLFLKLNPLCGTAIAPPKRAELERWLTTLKAAKATVDDIGLNNEQLHRQHRLLADAMNMLQITLAANRIETDQLRRYIRSASVDMEQNMREAGIAQVNGIHQQLLLWRKVIPDAEWAHVCFIVRGPQQPRGANAATLYLAALLRDHGDGRGYEGENARLVYREDTSLPTSESDSTPWEADLQLLAAIRMDAVASEAIFSDPDRLAVDIAADGARARVRELDFSAFR